MTEISVAIVGLGSRGLSVLERIVTLADLAGAGRAPGGVTDGALRTVRVELIDPTCSGAGVHEPRQPDYLLLNTTCSQVSMFPDPLSVEGRVGVPGPSLYEWVTGRGLRIAEDGFTVGTEGRPIRPTDFLPRRILGEYLQWFAAELRRRAPGHLRITMHPAAALDISPAPDGALEIALSDGTVVLARNVFLTTGYTPNTRPVEAGDGLIDAPYPLPEQVAAVGEVTPGQSVAIGGFGLSAMDVMSCLTVGRGGSFVADAGGSCRYLPSGREPTLLFSSRSGVPCRARPLVTQFGPPYRPVVFTPAAIDALRVAAGGRLDFQTDVLPLVLAEMRLAYRRCQARCAGRDTEQALARDLARDLAGATGLAGVTAVLDEWDSRCGPFDAAEALDGSAGMALDDSTAYQNWLAGVIGADLAEGVLGFAGSPLKAALDVLRDLRDTFRHAVDFGGLTDRSLDEFTWRTVPLLNRAVVGPQYERHVELLALMDAGVAHTPFGPAPTVSRHPGAARWTIASSRLRVPYSRDVDWIVSAHVELPAVETSASPLLSALHRKGWIRRHRPGSAFVHGIDVDRDQHPLDAEGEPHRRLWVLGPLCEGATFYNNLVPSPNTYSRPLFDAHRCVSAMLAVESQAAVSPYPREERAWTTSRR